MEIRYKPSFLREFKKLPLEVQREAKERIKLFSHVRNHEQLRVHKLKGKLKHLQSFSVTYHHRIVFDYESKNVAVFIAIGTHEIYQ